MQGYRFVICSRNTALGIFASMEDAKKAVEVTGKVKIFHESDVYMEGYIDHSGGRDSFTVTAVLLSSPVGPLF